MTENGKNYPPDLSTEERNLVIALAIEDYIKKGIRSAEEISRLLTESGTPTSKEDVQRLAGTTEDQIVAETENISQSGLPEENGLARAFREGVKKLKSDLGLPTDNPKNPEDVLRDLNQLGIIGTQKATEVKTEERKRTPLKDRKGVKKAQTIEILETPKETRSVNKKKDWTENDKKLHKLTQEIVSVVRKAKREKRELSVEEKGTIKDLEKETKALKAEVTKREQRRIESISKPKIIQRGGKWVNAETGEVIDIRITKKTEEIAKQPEIEDEMFAVRREMAVWRKKLVKKEIIKKTYFEEINKLQAQLNELKEKKIHPKEADGNQIAPQIKVQTELLPTPANKTREDELQRKVLLSDEEIEYLRSVGYTDESFKERDKAVRGGLNEMNFEDLQAEATRLMGEIKKIEDKGNAAFPGEKAHTKELERSRSRIQREINIRNKEQEEARASSTSSSVPAHAFENDYTPSLKNKEGLEEALKKSARDNFINSIPKSAFEDDQSGKIRRGHGDIESLEQTGERGTSTPVTAQQALDTIVNNAEQQAAPKIEALKKSRSKKFIDGADKALDWVGEKYNKIPLKYKLALSGALIAGASISSAMSGESAAMIASAAFCGTSLQRGLGAAATYVALQAVINKSLNEGFTKKGKDRVAKEGKNIYWLTKHPKAYALFFTAIIMGGGAYASHASKGVLGELLATSDISTGSMTGSPESKKACAEFLKQNMPQPESARGTTPVPTPETTVAPPAPTSPPLAEYTVSKGERGYDVLKKIPAIAELSGGRQTNAIENVLAVIRANPEKYGNLDRLAIGDKIDLEKIGEILETKTIKGEKIIEHAQNLSGEVVKNIESYVPGSNDYVPRNTIMPMATIEPTEFLKGESIESNDAVNWGTTAHAEDWANLQKYFYEDANLSETGLSKESSLALQTARVALETKLDDMFGTKGFLGIGKVRGVDSQIWNSLKNVEMRELARFKSTLPEFLNMQSLATQLVKESGETPGAKETVENFMKRAYFAIAKKGGIAAI